MSKENRLVPIAVVAREILVEARQFAVDNDLTDNELAQILGCILSPLSFSGGK